MLHICASVVLHNPDYSLVGKFESYIDAFPWLIVVDNSELPDKSVVGQILDLSLDIQYIHNGENLGIGTALNIACEAAIAADSDWLLTMDQDGRFENIETYLLNFELLAKNENIALVAPSMNVNTTAYEFLHDEVTLAITSGNLLYLKAFDKIGKFEDMLFIDEVDHDYCLRAKLNGSKVIQFKNILFSHKIGYKKELTSSFHRRKKIRVFLE
jgi:rhamnosyltransferase